MASLSQSKGEGSGKGKQQAEVEVAAVSGMGEVLPNSEWCGQCIFQGMLSTICVSVLFLLMFFFRHLLPIHAQGKFLCHMPCLQVKVRVALRILNGSCL